MSCRADLGNGALVVMRHFTGLQNTNIKYVDHQEDWRLFSKTIETNSEGKSK